MGIPWESCREYHRECRKVAELVRGIAVEEAMTTPSGGPCGYICCVPEGAAVSRQLLCLGLSCPAD